MAPEKSELLKLAIDPISDASSAGTSAAYDTEFEQLRNEIAKLESVTREAIDCDLIIRLSTSILKSKSKDLRVVGYLTLGLFQTQGHAGLLNGLVVYHNLLKNFWETLFPEKNRMRGRVGAVEWLSERVGAAVARREADDVPDDLILELGNQANELSSAAQELFRDNNPGINALLEAVNSRVSKIQARKAALEQAAKEKEKQAAAFQAGEVTDAVEAQRLIRDCQTKLRRMANFLRQNNPAEPLSYRISRTTTWGWLTSLPPNNKGTTQIPSVRPELSKNYENWTAKGEWLVMLHDAESRFPELLFCLDLQRHSARALSELGEKYAPAREVVVTELAVLLGRFPGVLELKYADGIPIADDLTRSWCQNEVNSMLAGRGDARPERRATVVHESSELEEAVTEARQLLVTGKLQEAIGLFQEGIGRAPYRRLRFLWRLYLSKLCMEAGKPQLALPQLTSLDEDVKRFELEEWEPELCLEVVQQLFQCRQKLVASLKSRPAEVEHQLGELYERLCRLDVNAALTVDR